MLSWSILHSPLSYCVVLLHLMFVIVPYMTFPSSLVTSQFNKRDLVPPKVPHIICVILNHDLLLVMFSPLQPIFRQQSAVNCLVSQSSHLLDGLSKPQQISSRLLCHCNIRY